MLKEGDKVPGFELEDQTGRTVTDRSFRGKKLVIYFYPKDNTPGCTTEACAFRDTWAQFEKAGAVVLGVSPDGVASHQKFIGKFGLPFILLADVQQKMAEDFGVWVKKKLYGREYMGVQRSTFLADSKGIIRRVCERVKPAGHPDEVLMALKELK